MHKFDERNGPFNAKKKMPLTMEQYVERIWGGANFVTRRLCGYACVFESDQEFDAQAARFFLRAKSMLEHFDSIFLLEDMDNLIKDGTLGQLFPALQFQHEAADKATNSSNTKKYARNQVSSALKSDERQAYSQEVLDKIHEHTWMDKVLYEYAKVLIETRQQ